MMVARVRLQANPSVLLIFLGMIFASSCVSARMTSQEIDRAYWQGDYLQSIAYLKEGLAKQGEDGKDRLLYLLDLGMAQHRAGLYADSIVTLHEADRLAEIKDYTSIAAEAATVLVSDNTKDYRAEEFEGVLISALLALDYAALGEWEEAQVEARRVNRKLYLLVSEGGRQYALSPFSEYLAGILYEAQGEWNDALVSYKKTHELAPQFREVAQDWWRMAARLRMADEQERVEKIFSISREERAQWKAQLKDKNLVSLVAVIESGHAPTKVPHPQFHEVPRFVSRSSPLGPTRLLIDGKDWAGATVLHDVEASAIQNLEQKYASILAKKIAGRVAKYAVGRGVEGATKSRFLGALTYFVLYLADQADLRSWSLLPRDLAIARAWVPAGLRRVRLQLANGAGSEDREIELKTGTPGLMFFHLGD